MNGRPDTEESAEHWVPVRPELTHGVLISRVTPVVEWGDTAEMIVAEAGSGAPTEEVVGLWASLSVDLTDEYVSDEGVRDVLGRVEFSNVCYFAFIFDDFQRSLPDIDGFRHRTALYETRWFLEHDVFYSSEDSDWSPTPCVALYESLDTARLDSLREHFAYGHDPEPWSRHLKHFRFFVNSVGVLDVVALRADFTGAPD